MVTSTVSKPIYSDLLKPIPQLSGAELRAFERKLQRAEEPEAVKTLLAKTFNVPEDNLSFLHKLGGTAKLRELYFEHIKFDLANNTNTISFISEELFRQIAQEEPDALAAPDHASGAVKHRPSLPSVIRSAFGQVTSELTNRGFNVDDASLFDIGCGSGRIIMMGMSSPNYAFAKAVGIDFCKPLLEVAENNLNSTNMSLNNKDNIKFVFEDAAEFRGYNGLNIVCMYNPISDKEIIKDIEYNLRNYAGKTMLVYIKPEHIDVFRDKNWTRVIEQQSTDKDKQISVYSWGFDR